MIASMPMYDWPEIRLATDAFWACLRMHLRGLGLETPNELLHDAQYAEAEARWRQSDLLFSQTCGYPFATQLMDSVRLIATPVYDVAGCSGPTYTSAVLVRADDPAHGLKDVRNGCFAFNSRTSLSGYRCLTSSIGDPQDWFAQSCQSGGHRQSALMVARGEADCAAVDAVCWHLFGQFEPEAAAKLRVLEWTKPLPALPFITHRSQSDETVSLLRKGLLAAVEGFDWATVPQLPRIKAVCCLDEAEYLPLSSL